MAKALTKVAKASKPANEENEKKSDEKYDDVIAEASKVVKEVNELDESVEKHNLVKKHKKKISLFFLPAYAPQYNPDEYLNNDLKRNVNRKHIPLTKSELQSNLRSYLKTLQNKPQHIQKFFEAEDVKYAA